MSLFLRPNPKQNTIEIIQLIDECGLEVLLSSEIDPKAAEAFYRKSLDAYNKGSTLKLLTLKKPDDEGNWGSDGGSNI